mgnify:CR=1 FL=1|jgi:hypothetical protein
MPDNVQIRNFIEAYQGKTVHLTNGTSIRFTKAAAETALHLLSHRLPADDGGYHDVFPSIGRLAQLAGKTDRAIQMRLVQLERLGLTRRISRYREDGRYTSNYYIFSVPEVLRKQQRLAVDKKRSATIQLKPSPPMACKFFVSKDSLSRDRFTIPSHQPFTLKGNVNLKRSTTSDPTYLDQSNHNTVTPKALGDTEVVVFCNRFQATPNQKEALLRAVQCYGPETVREAITITMANITAVKLPFNYVIGTAARIAQKQQYLAVLQQEKEARKIESEREEIVLKACFRYRDASRIFDSSRAFAVAVLEVIILRRPDQREIIEELSRRILIPSQDVA